MTPSELSFCLRFSLEYIDIYHFHLVKKNSMSKYNFQGYLFKEDLKETIWNIAFKPPNM